MKKICIITVYGNQNIGNKLQNYALQKVLENYGFEVETLINESSKVYTNEEKVREILKKPYLLFKKIFNVFLKYGNYKKIKSRNTNFIQFNNNHINYTSYKILSNNIPEGFHKKYDYFVIGSDQVWNYNFNTFSSIMFALFAPKEKNIAYAASFGVSEIPNKYRELYVKGLNNISKISLREDAGTIIVNDLIGENSEVIIDPTMLLSKDEWVKISKMPEKFNKNKKYILIYFLGEISDQRKSLIEDTVKKNKGEIINILDMNSNFYSSGPSEFIYLIKNSEMIITDSFHACVFSILFDRPFYVFDREDSHKSMNSRMDTLLTKFHLEDRKANDDSELSVKIDYSRTYQILNQEKKLALEFLEKSLDIKEK